MSRRTCEELGMCQMHPNCKHKCNERRAIGGMPNFPFAPGVIDHRATHTPRQLLWRWLRRTLALMAAAITGLLAGYLTRGLH